MTYVVLEKDSVIKHAAPPPFHRQKEHLRKTTLQCQIIKADSEIMCYSLSAMETDFGAKVGERFRVWGFFCSQQWTF